MKKFFLKLRSLPKKTKIELILLLFVLLLGAFLRLYNISGYMTFLGDEGRDAIVVRRLLVNRDLILIGPGTSIGNMYLGPLYYYLIAPSLLIANFSPVGPSVFVALLGVATIYLVYFLSKKWFYKDTERVAIGALVGALLYAISPVLIIYSRSSWNPNVMPFFSLICIWSLYKIWQERKHFWILVLAISYAFVLQSHYLGLTLLPTIGIFWILSLRNLKRSDSVLKEEKRSFIKYSLISILVFVFLMSPLVIFDARHGWNNFGAIGKFFSERQTTISARPWNALPKVIPIMEKVSERILAGANQKTGDIALFVLIALKIYFVFSMKKIERRERSAYLLLLSWFGFCILGLGLYKQEIYDHYFGVIFAAPFLTVAGIGKNILSKKKKYWNIFFGVSIFILVLANAVHNPLLDPANYQVRRAINVADKIKSEAKGERINLAVLAERNYEDGYQYFLEKDNVVVLDIDAQRLDETVSDELFVVCEMPKEKCDPTHSPKAEVANFGWSKVDGEWIVDGTYVFRLVHSQK